jgi:hypothetical protein
MLHREPRSRRTPPSSGETSGRVIRQAGAVLADVVPMLADRGPPPRGPGRVGGRLETGRFSRAIVVVGPGAAERGGGADPAGSCITSGIAPGSGRTSRTCTRRVHRTNGPPVCFRLLFTPPDPGRPPLMAATPAMPPLAIHADGRGDLRAGALGAAERRCGKPVPYEKRHDGTEYQFKMPGGCRAWSPR